MIDPLQLPDVRLPRSGFQQGYSGPCRRNRAGFGSWNCQPVKRQIREPTRLSVATGSEAAALEEISPLVHIKHLTAPVAQQLGDLLL